MGKEGLARVFAVRIQGSRTHFSNLRRSCATVFDMVVYSRFADDDDTMLWLRFRARKRFRREHLSIDAQHRRWAVTRMRLNNAYVVLESNTGCRWALPSSFSTGFEAPER